MIVKHANPCGVAIAERIEDAYARALAADPVSAYGGVVVFNRPVTAALGEALAGQFVEVLFAPGYDEQAMEALAGEDLGAHPQRHRAPRLVETERDYKRVLGGLLVQDRDWALPEREHMEVVCGEVANDQWLDLLFAWRVVKHVTSNAIVLAKRGQTLGIGAGQTSRVDAVRIAVEKAQRARPRSRGRGARVGRVLPVRGRRRGRARGGDRGDHPARRLEAGRRGGRGGLEGRARDGPHAPPPLPALGQEPLHSFSDRVAGADGSALDDARVHAAEPQRAAGLPVHETDRRRAEALGELAQPVCGTSVTSTTAVPTRRRVPGGRFSGRRSRST